MALASASASEATPTQMNAECVDVFLYNFFIFFLNSHEFFSFQIEARSAAKSLKSMKTLKNGENRASAVA